MQTLIGAALAALLTSAAIGAQNKPPTPQEQYQALLKDHLRASSSGRPLTDAERLKFVGQAYQHRFALGLKFLDLAEKHPNHPVAVDALIQAVWQVNTTPWPVELVGEDKARGRAFELLIHNYIGSDKLAPLCQRISYGFCREYETFLRAVLKSNPHKTVQAAAMTSLGHFLHNRMERVALCQDEPELANEFADLFGKEYFANLQRQERSLVVKESEALFEQALAKYGDVPLPAGDSTADQAKSELFAIRMLSMGRKALDTEGVDQDGKEFKLSDYRGKVVLLDFWSYV
jgi:AhpC/TSA family.